MNRDEWINYIAGTYDEDAEFPWAKYPKDMVFRHSNNRKWFALIMEIPKEKLGIPGDGMLDILNVKCNPVLIDSLRKEPGFFPAYHMNKTNWVTVALDGSADDDRIKLVLDMSFELTARKVKRAAGANEGC